MVKVQPQRAAPIVAADFRLVARELYSAFFHDFPESPASRQPVYQPAQ